LLHPDAEVREKFFVCIEGNIVYGNCPDGFWFNANSGKCQEKELVKNDSNNKNNQSIVADITTTSTEQNTSSEPITTPEPSEPITDPTTTMETTTTTEQNTSSEPITTPEAVIVE
jgi:hypothetical protein